MTASVTVASQGVTGSPDTDGDLLANFADPDDGIECADN
jgi:hypothetical protein